MIRRALPLLLLAACASPSARVQERIESGTPEERYEAILQLSGERGETTRRLLRRLLRSEEPLIRNAAARVLCERNEKSAAAELIGNLHRDQRTYVTMDALWHLRALFGIDLGYDANRGYRHQTYAQQQWREWFARQPFGYSLAEPEAAPGEEVRVLRRDLRRDLEEWKRARPDPVPAFEAHYERAGRLFHASRAPDDMALLEDYVGALCRFHPDLSRCWNGHALTALNNSDYETAESSYRRALELAPDSAQLWNDLGILLEGLGRLEEAETCYDRACEFAPEDDVAWSNLGDVRRRLGRDDEAIAAYREAERLAPEKWYYHRLWIARLQGRMR